MLVGTGLNRNRDGAKIKLRTHSPLQLISSASVEPTDLKPGRFMDVSLSRREVFNSGFPALRALHMLGISALGRCIGLDKHLARLAAAAVFDQSRSGADTS